MTTAILPVIGLIIGASLQYFFTRYLESYRYHRNFRTQAYLDYLRCACEQTHMRSQRQSPEGGKVFAQITDAKARICLYGSMKVIQALALFDRLGSSMRNDQQCKTFIEMLSAMREDSGSESGAKLADLEQILLGKRDVTK